MDHSADDQAGPGSRTPADASAAGAPAPAARVNLAGSQGIQVGDHNLQYNTFVTPPPLPDRIVAGNIPQEPPARQLREDLTAKLRAAGPGVSVVRAVTGMRGVGKTQLAAGYARECVLAGWRLVAWVNAETTPETLNGLAVVADRLGLVRPGADLDDTVTAVRNHLEADGDRCLLVFDNVTDLPGLRPYVPSSGGCQVIVTSTAVASAGMGKPIAVDVYTPEESLAFLVERTGLQACSAGRDCADGAADGPVRLAEELGRLPLALAQAAAVIADQRLTYPVYLSRLRTLPLSEYLTAGQADAYPRGTAEAIILSLDAVAVADEPDRCTQILDLISLLSPAGVSRDLLHGAAPEVPAHVVDATLGRLAGASLLSFSDDGAAVAAHRLVTRVVRERRAQDGTLPAIAARVCAVLVAARAKLGEQWQNRAPIRDWIQHVITLTACIGPDLDTRSTDLEKPLLALRGQALGDLADLGDSFEQALEMGEPVVADQVRVLGSLHPGTLVSQTSLAYAYLALGRHGEAIQLCEAVLAGREQVLGHSHMETLASRNNLAYAYRAAGRVTEAIPLFEVLLAERERLLGDSHPDTLVSRTNLAHAYQLTGRADEAIRLGEIVLAERERRLGSSHPDTLTARNNLARSYETAGRLPEAILQYDKALEGFERLLGTDHPNVLHVRKNLERARSEASPPG